MVVTHALPISICEPASKLIYKRTGCQPYCHIITIGGHGKQVTNWIYGSHVNWLSLSVDMEDCTTPLIKKRRFDGLNKVVTVHEKRCLYSKVICKRIRTENNAALKSQAKSWPLKESSYFIWAENGIFYHVHRTCPTWRQQTIMYSDHWRTFETDSELKTTIGDFFDRGPTEFYNKDIHRLLCRWKPVTENSGHYTDFWYASFNSLHHCILL